MVIKLSLQYVTYVEQSTKRNKQNDNPILPVLFIVIANLTQNNICINVPELYVYIYSDLCLPTNIYIICSSLYRLYYADLVLHILMLQFSMGCIYSFADIQRVLLNIGILKLL